MNHKKLLTLCFAIFFMVALVAMVGCEEPEEEVVEEEPEEAVEEEPEEEVAEEEPEEDISIDIIVGFGAGGSNDLTARYLADYLADQGIIASVVNMPGGMSTEAAYHVAGQDPDANMFFWGHTGPLLFEPAAGDRGYTIDDFEPVAVLAAPAFCIGARPGAPWGDDFEALIEYIEENPGEVTFGGQGEGNVRHYAVEQILPPDELDYTFVGLEGGADVAMNLQGEHVDVGHLSLAAASPLVADGELWAVVNTNPLVDRVDLMPDVPNVAEFGIPEGQEPHPIGLWAVKGTDPAMIDRLTNAIKEVSEDPGLQESYNEMGVVLQYLGPDEAWEFYMNVQENVVPDYMEWLEAYTAAGN